MNTPNITESEVNRTQQQQSMPDGRVKTGLTNIGRGLKLTGLAIWEALLVVWVCVCVCLLIVGIGVFLLPGALNMVRSEARRQRRLAIEYSGVRVAENYLPDPISGAGLKSSWKRLMSRAVDPAAWKDLLWHILNPFIGPLMALLPAVAVVHGVWGLVLPFLWKTVIKNWENSWYAIVPLRNEGTAIAAAALGVVEIIAALVLARFFVDLHARWVAAVLSTMSREQLQERVEHLSKTRSEAVTHEALEIRRIERDLHDGAQARLVAMGMTLTVAERVMDEHPEAARILVQEAKQTSAAALAELRDLVRGIHPPVLADRGLVDAIRARALESPMEVKVRSSIGGRPLPPLESAVYFAVSELLANIAKHAEATEIKIDVTYDSGALRVAVTDNGHGGADPDRGSGLRGVERRLAAFDGVLLVHSPEGGPTTVSVSVPCLLTSDGSN